MSWDIKLEYAPQPTNLLNFESLNINFTSKGKCRNYEIFPPPQQFAELRTLQPFLQNLPS